MTLSFTYDERPKMPDSEVIVEQIRSGYWDKHLKAIAKAIGERTGVRQAEVLALVHEVYGAHAEIAIKR